MSDQIREIQRLVGVPADGAWGPVTAAAVLKALQARKTLRLTTEPPTAEIAPDGALRASQAGLDLIHSFEQCRLTSYKDPGSSDGLPITAGWGTTVDEDGGPIPLGAVWTQEKADRLFQRDIASREAKLNEILGDAPTTQAQYDGLLSLGYNIGMGALAGSTTMRRHKEGDHEGAATAFSMWVKNSGQVMRGLVRRRAAEADMYRGLLR